MPAAYLALLRGINVGGKNKLPMPALIEIFDEAGCWDVRTYIQSGNVLFQADAAQTAVLPAEISARIAARFGYQIPVVVRTADQLAQIVQMNPFIAAGAPEETLHVLFLADPPSGDRIARLDPDRSPPDTFIVRGQEVYLRLPGGVARTKLTNAYFDAQIATTSTSRNWRTVTTLSTLMG